MNGEVETIESDVDTVLAQVDKAIRINADSPWLAHLELQANYDARLPSRMLQYNALLSHRHQVPVESTVVLLRPEADGPEMTGLFEQHGPTGFRIVAFGFHVIRLWQRPVEELLGGSLGILPLAPLADVGRDRLPSLIDHVQERLRREAPPTIAEEHWAAAYLLLGLRYDADVVRGVAKDMSWLQESSTYRAIIAEGEARGEARGQALGARRLIVALGTEKFGPPPQSVLEAVEDIDDLDRLEHLSRRILTANGWEELLGSDLGR